MPRVLLVALSMLAVFLFYLASKYFRGTPIPDATEWLVASFIVAWMSEKGGE